ncbi:Uncharacterised protein [Neisseria meningitidis]|uniref:Uncharacterized protein n=1 Tax=Neisseria meningitidis TaxID=487 RepID=A0AB33U033_NEIME|nr:hypothetical protein NMEN255_2056 [Neisseria meningitidis NM255]EJU62047.1 hypothetical protein NMEN69166_2081 [Neisseria meningitidis 69166]EJU64141.1 hypothetical protein NMEN98008_2079 [Neisseria meningitidis 98008]EJU69079.1 hypothetical protein NMEN92045_2114 [Neisseria meningitidis 92045]ELK62271.1 putative membrane protein [Neisseria meningitidis 68094]ELK63097.1 putative membrane protein [Neisseria meningitidis 97021]ELK63391.1 putative membrane protein [Neisseria meningitidis 8805
MMTIIWQWIAFIILSLRIFSLYTIGSRHSLGSYNLSIWTNIYFHAIRTFPCFILSLI